MVELTLTGLRVMLEVACSGSFSAAAETLGYTQSAISRQVAQTERAAQASLFERQARGVRLTPAGEVLVRHAATVLDGVASATQELAGMRDRLAGRLAVGGYPAVTSVLLPRAIARLATAHPGLDVRLTEASTPAQLQALRRGRLEVALVATGEGLPDYDLHELDLTRLESDQGIGVAVHATHPFVVRDYVKPADLLDQRWIVGGGDRSSPQFEAWPGLAEPRVAFTARSWPTRLGLVAAGLGIALMPGVAADSVPAGVRWIPIREGGGIRRTTWAATSAEPTPAARAMIRALVAELESWKDTPA